MSNKNNAFSKAAVFTDIHFGAKSNSDQHNEDCLKFIDWFVKTARENGCETCIFLGDYHNNRSSMNIKTMQYAERGLSILNEGFDRVYFIPGNHDLFFKEKRDALSTPWAKLLENVVVIDDWMTIGDVTFAPWLIGDDFKKIKQKSGKYLFGHFELPGYMMNSLVVAPNSGEIDTDSVAGFEHVFSGHFHKRQSSKNVTYIGNAFPINFNDVNDDDRGMMILEWDKEPEFLTWPNQPTYRECLLSQIVSSPEDILKENSYVRIHMDTDITFEESTELKETLISNFNLRDVSLLPIRHAIEDAEGVGEIVYESVDTIVTSQLQNIDSEKFDKDILLTIYNGLN